MDEREFLSGKVRLFAGDCREVLRCMADNSVDSVVTDPPYHLMSIVKRFGSENAKPVKSNMESPGGAPQFKRLTKGFMGKQWDGGDIAFQPELWAEVLRVLKPGSTCLAMGGDRTVHRLACAMEDAGFEIQGQLVWAHGQGFPKNLNVGRSLSSLPWCSCGGGEKASSGTINPISSRENYTAIDTCFGEPGASSFDTFLELPDVDSITPLQDGRTRIGTACTSMQPHGSSTNSARRLGNELSGCSGHGRSVVNGSVKDTVGNLSPVMLRSSDVTVVTEGDQVRHDVGGIKVEPKTLRNEVVGNELAASSAVSTDCVTRDDGGGNVLPSATFVRPSSPAPGGVAISTKPISVTDCHTGLRAVDGCGITASKEATEFIVAGGACEARGAAFEPSAPTTSKGDCLTSGAAFTGTKFGPGKSSEEVDSTLFADFGGHSETIRYLVTERKVFVCEICGSPKRPTWVFEGLGTALKPAVELIIRARKPLSESSIAQNVLKWGVGAINVGACKVGLANGEVLEMMRPGVNPNTDPAAPQTNRNIEPFAYKNDSGRWPANLIHDGSDEVLACFPDSKSAGGINDGEDSELRMGRNSNSSHAGGLGDSGSAARFFASFPQDDVQRIFYTSKAGADDRLGSKHPTVKPIDLIQYLVRLVTPPKGTCLDLFAGTGTTAEAAFREGFSAILIENDPESIADIERRMSLMMEGPDTRAYASMKARNRPRDDGPLFGQPEKIREPNLKPSASPRRPYSDDTAIWGNRKIEAAE